MAKILFGVLLALSVWPFTVAVADDRETMVDTSPPRSGTLLRPQAGPRQAEGVQRCVPVCIQWGQDCTVTRYGTNRCRRTCHRFVQECYDEEGEE